MCPYREHHGCWFGHDDDLEDVSPCRDVAATSALPLRTGTPVFVGLEAEPGVPMRQVTEEIVDCVGQWEKIVDDRFLQVLEQIVEVLKVLPEQIASQLSGWVYEERISERSGADCRLARPAGHGVCRVAVGVCRGADRGFACASDSRRRFAARAGARAQLRPQIMEDRMHKRTPEQIADTPVPQIMEAVVEVVPSTPQDSVQNLVEEQIADSPVPLFMGQLFLRHKCACRIVRQS